MVTIAIINLKGGVGKSVTTVNLADRLAARGLSVLVGDLDKQANTTKFFGLLNYELPSMSDILKDGKDVRDVIRTATFEAPGRRLLTVDVLPANMTLLAANREVLLDMIHPQQNRLRTALQPLRTIYDAVLLDCPPDLDMGSVNALCAADWVIIPVDCDEWAADGLDVMLEQIRAVRDGFNPGLRAMALITKYNRTNYGTRIAKSVTERGVLPMDTVIRRTVKVQEAIAAHKPLSIYAPGCTAAQDYDALAEEVILKTEMPAFVKGAREG